jgi:hypothetical protein
VATGISLKTVVICSILFGSYHFWVRFPNIEGEVQDCQNITRPKRPRLPRELGGFGRWGPNTYAKIWSGSSGHFPNDPAGDNLKYGQVKVLCTAPDLIWKGISVPIYGRSVFTYLFLEYCICPSIFWNSVHKMEASKNGTDDHCFPNWWWKFLTLSAAWF